MVGWDGTGYNSDRIEMEAGATSLQNIVNHHERIANKQDIFTLFTRKQYPQFQLDELAQHSLNRTH